MYEKLCNYPQSPVLCSQHVYYPAQAPQGRFPYNTRPWSHRCSNTDVLKHASSTTIPLHHATHAYLASRQSWIEITYATREFIPDLKSSWKRITHAYLFLHIMYQDVVRFWMYMYLFIKGIESTDLKYIWPCMEFSILPLVAVILCEPCWIGDRYKAWIINNGIL